MNLRKVMITVIVAICIFSLVYAIYLVVNKNKTGNISNIIEDDIIQAVEFDDLFDNKMNYQNYEVGNENKINTTKELVYTAYSQNQAYEGKYDINVNLPIININNIKVREINREIITVFGEKAENIIASSDKENMQNTIYTVEYTAYLNSNILSLVIKATLKEGNNAQRVIIKSYTYNISSNEEIPLETMIEIKELNPTAVKNQIVKTIQESVAKNANLSALGYNIYQRDLNSDIYEIKNSNNYFLGPDGTIYIIYAYGNTRYTSEKDIVVIK